jgi:hypothetical protein
VFTDVSEEYTVSIFRLKERQVNNKKGESKSRAR